ncbi:MAG: non-ribosomal peptide synthetase, partial [Alphaproteobacteria bacterium]|nr:non-ribosomal peptide synthetase [Alphaproteobacteria bacterium]
FRIELGEIENVLSSCKDVKASIVVAREEEGNKRLVGYVVPSEEARRDLILQSTFKSSSGEMIDILGGEGLGTIIENIRNDLTKQLPDYMVPSFFVLIGKIPLTANGKVDKKILPSPDINLTISTKYVGPRNEIERKLCEIWSEVLRIEKIGIYDNFFEIGGHSLLATQVISRIRKDLEVELPLKTLFSAPTIAGISEGVERLKGTAVVIPAITAEIRPKRIPLSFAQQRLWFLDQLLPNQSLYNIPMALRLKGQLDIDALEKALDYIIQRHEILRTHIESEEGEAYQVINLDFRFILERVDLRSVVGKARNEEASRLIRAEASRLFELGKGPLIRGKILILGSEENIFILNMHHIISDGWSFDIFLKELRGAYNAYRRGDSPIDLPLMIQYADFAIWQRNWLQGEILEKQLEYWQKELDGIPEVIALPTDYARPQELSYSGGVHVYHISKELLAKIKGISESQGTTLFMTLLGAFQVLLYRYTGQEDIVIGSPIANRHYKEIEELIGFFINTLALRGKLRGELTFYEVLSQVKETTLNAYAHQDVPFEQLVDHLQVTRKINCNPVFQVVFVLQNTGNTNFELEGIESRFVGSDTALSKFDLSLFGREVEDGLILSFEYAKDLFKSETIERLARHFVCLLEEIVLEPNKDIREYNILSAEERQQIIVDWNRTETEYPRDKTIQQLFEEQVERTPDSVAVVFGDKQLSYEELNSRANQFAHYLRDLGITKETLVAISLERSFELIISLLAILKSGGAYVSRRQVEFYVRGYESFCSYH